MTPRPAPATAAASIARLAAVTTQPLAPARQTFPAPANEPVFDADEELILQLQVAGFATTDTIIAYGDRDGVYLPLGELARILDLAIRISDDGHYASGWFLAEERTLEINLRAGTVSISGQGRTLPASWAAAYEGEMYVTAAAVAQLLPLTLETDLRGQRVLLTTLEPFPFEERVQRDRQRAQLAARQNGSEAPRWPREETPYLAASVPLADVELRALSDTTRGTRVEGDLQLAGDLLWMTAQSRISASSNDGLLSAVVELGRRDPDGELLGPLRATDFQVGDVATTSLPIGLRGATGRGAFVTNQPLESTSVFDRVDLRGALPAGYEVELYRNDVLLFSTRESVNGQYEFLDVPVDYGLNVMRLVFYGPNGQRREEVRRISVGDGRLAQGQLVYALGAVQRGVNLLGVKGPDFNPVGRYGDWQGVADLAYGVTADLTTTASLAVFENGLDKVWMLGAGLRTGLGGLSLRADAGTARGGGYAGGLGLGGRALGGAFTLSHFEYGGGFIDETHALSDEPIRRVTEFDFSTSLALTALAADFYLPLTGRLRRQAFADGRVQTNAALRASARLPGLIASNTTELARTQAPGSPSTWQVLGNFDLATFNRSRTQVRGSLGYRLGPDPAITSVSGEVSHALDDVTVVRASSSYAVASDEVSFSLSAAREFDRFTLALDGRYNVAQRDYSVALRLGLSLGRDPLRQRLFAAPPGLASSGALAARVFQDLDGDGVASLADPPIEGVGVVVQNGTAQTDAGGRAFLGRVGDGNRVSVQIDQSTLPDIAMAPVTRGREIVPRPGRIHVTSFPIVALSEVEGTVSFGGADGARGVSGLRLQLRNAGGEVEHFVRTERGGYYFFEQVKPGTYELLIDPEQAARLGICLASAAPLVVGPQGDIYSQDLLVSNCDDPA